MDFETWLADNYEFVVEAPGVDAWRIFDTFDWLLFNRAMMLRRTGSEFALVALNGGTIRNCEIRGGDPVFARDFPEGVLRSDLARIINERALFPLAEVYVEETSYRILDDEQKTVARLIRTQVRGEGDEFGGADSASFLGVRTLRGYEKHARRLAKELAAWGEGLNSMDEAILLSALRMAGQTPNSYSSRLDVRLKPEMRADAAARAIMQRLLETIRANEEGIKADTDIEFLHDYRIAVRRTRSALSLIKGVFSPEMTDHFKQEFRTLGKFTNDLRDLDVYLLAEEGYRAQLPGAMKNDIAPLFDYLRAHRVVALDAVTETLESEAYARTLDEWAAFLNESTAVDSAVNASQPIISLARKRIRKQYQRIVQDGSFILSHTEDELLHALRIECKKLRYLLEFFESLFPPRKMGQLIKQLKRLQDNLGEFSDLTVQQNYLLAVAEALDIDEVLARRALVSTGFLVETMARRQQEVKSEFAGTFTKFASPAHQRQFHRLFGSGKGRRKI
ncbi:MAG: CHAD domain-containing protein [Caldilineales bacterium]|nr:CHAD domain-containing protein [Caldilineales bacterium]